MIIKIDIHGCSNCPFCDTEWGCNLIENGLIEDCPFFDGAENEIIIKNEKEK